MCSALDWLAIIVQAQELNRSPSLHINASSPVCIGLANSFDVLHYGSRGLHEISILKFDIGINLLSSNRNTSNRHRRVFSSMARSLVQISRHWRERKSFYAIMEDGR